MEFSQEYTKDIARKIKSLCAINKLTVNKLLLECGINTSFITDLNKGKMPSVDKIVKLANYFNVSTDYFITNEDCKFKNERIDGEMEYSKEVLDTIRDFMIKWAKTFNKEIEGVLDTSKDYTLDDLDEKSWELHFNIWFDSLVNYAVNKQIKVAKENAKLLETLDKLDDEGKTIVQATAYKELRRIKSESQQNEKNVPETIAARRYNDDKQTSTDDRVVQKVTELSRKKK